MIRGVRQFFPRGRFLNITVHHRKSFILPVEIMKEKKHLSLHLFFWQAPSAPCTECFLPRHFLLNYPGPLGKKTLPNKLHFLQPFAAKRKRKQLEAMASFSKLPSRTEPRLNASSFPLHRSVSPFPVKHGYETHPETGKNSSFILLTLEEPECPFSWVD